jgi:hypothetical protein
VEKLEDLVALRLGQIEAPQGLHSRARLAAAEAAALVRMNRRRDGKGEAAGNEQAREKRIAA